MTRSLFDLTDRVALVAGGGGYLGAPVCEALSAHGAQVVVADLNEQAADAVADRISGAKACRLDVGDEGSIRSVCDSLESLDVLVNLTMFSRGRQLDEATADDWAAGLKVTLTGAAMLSQAAAGRMGEGGGSIVHFASMYGLVSPDPHAYVDMKPNPPDYGAAKAGVIQLTRYQAVFWAKRNIRVNAIAPGPFPNTQDHGADAAFVERLNQRVPMGRVGRSDEIAGSVVYLSSNASSYVTGTTLRVDGGWTAW